MKQISLINRKGAGRPAIHDSGIRHIERPVIKRTASLHLTVKIKRNKADLKNKSVLSILKKAIMNARNQGLRVIHYSLEYDHIHLLIEAENNSVLARGMQSFGVTFSKAINRLRKLKGGVYKHRYHFRQISSPSELKNVLHYIFSNGVKHKTSGHMINPYNSIRAEMKYYLFFKGKLSHDSELLCLLDRGKIYFRALDFI